MSWGDNRACLLAGPSPHHTHTNGCGIMRHRLPHTHLSHITLTVKPLSSLFKKKSGKKNKQKENSNSDINLQYGTIPRRNIIHGLHYLHCHISLCASKEPTGDTLPSLKSPHLLPCRCHYLQPVMASHVHLQCHWVESALLRCRTEWHSIISVSGGPCISPLSLHWCLTLI